MTSDDLSVRAGMRGGKRFQNGGQPQSKSKNAEVKQQSLITFIKDSFFFFGMEAVARTHTILGDVWVNTEQCVSNHGMPLRHLCSGFFSCVAIKQRC